MLERSQRQHADRGDDRREITRAREEAEALFRPKQQLIERSAPQASPPVDTVVRKPRVLAVTASPAPIPDAARGASINLTQKATREIPPSQVARIRAWVKYGMTVSQAAEVCGATVDEIERISGRRPRFPD